MAREPHISCTTRPGRTESPESGFFRRAATVNLLDELLALRCRVVEVVPTGEGLTIEVERLHLLDDDGSRGLPGRLAPEEERLLRAAADGASGVALAIEFGVSEATVSRRLERALSCIGLRRGTLGICSRLLAVAEVREDEAVWCESYRVLGPDAWSAGERQVALLCLAGLAPREIAFLRASSEVTVRKQILAAARKAGCSDRFELGASRHIRFERDAHGWLEVARVPRDGALSLQSVA